MASGPERTLEEGEEGNPVRTRGTAARESEPKRELNCRRRRVAAVAGKRVCRMSRVVEYTVVAMSKKEDFIREVNKLLTEGWEPHGSLTFFQEPGKGMTAQYVQPMVKRDQTEG